MACLSLGLSKWLHWALFKLLILYLCYCDRVLAPICPYSQPGNDTVMNLDQQLKPRGMWRPGFLEVQVRVQRRKHVVSPFCLVTILVGSNGRRLEGDFHGHLPCTRASRGFVKASTGT